MWFVHRIPCAYQRWYRDSLLCLMVKCLSFQPLRNIVDFRVIFLPPTTRNSVFESLMRRLWDKKNGRTDLMQDFKICNESETLNNLIKNGISIWWSSEKPASSNSISQSVVCKWLIYIRNILGRGNCLVILYSSEKIHGRGTSLL